MRKWNVPKIDRSAQIAAKIRDYVERLEAIADLARRAAEDVVERGEIVKVGKRTAYKGPAGVEISAERSDGRAAIAAKYGERTTRVELEGMGRAAILANLAAIAVHDDPDFHGGYLLHNTGSAIQAADRLLMWGALLPGKYAIDVRYVYISKDKLLPFFAAHSLFGAGGREAVMASPVHRPILRAAMDLGGLDGDRILAVAWLFISAIFNTPGRPSEGPAELAKRLAAKRGEAEGKYKAALEPLRPYLEELDGPLGPISRGDKAFLAGKMADYGGRVVGDRAIAYAGNIEDMRIVLNDVEMDMADIAEAAAKAFSERGGRGSRILKFVGISPVEGPAIEAAAEEEALKDVIKYGEPIAIAEGIEITPVEAREIVARIAPEDLKEVLRGFKNGYYTHLRLVVNDKGHDFLCSIRRHGRLAFTATARAGLEEALGIKARADGMIAFGVERLRALITSAEAYAVRKAKKGEAMWPVKIRYKGITMELKMSYRARRKLLQRVSNNGRIGVVVDGRTVEMDLAAMRAGGRGIEGMMAEALNAAGVKWYVDNRRLYIKHT